MCNILFISDIHFGSLSRDASLSIPGQEIEDNTEGAVSIIDGIKRIIAEKKVEYIIIGGDITSTANPLEFHYCRNVLLDIANSCGMSEKKIFFTIGNHDIDFRITKIVDDESFDWLSSDDRELLKNYYRVISSNSPKHSFFCNEFSCDGPVFSSGVIDNDSFTCFVLNSSSFCGHYQEPSHGQLSKIQLQWFAETAKTYKDNGKWKVVLLHHHPISYKYPINEGVDTSIISDGNEFLEIASQNNINLVLHGHRHHPRVSTKNDAEWNNPIIFVCAGSMSVNAHHRSNGEIPNTIHVINLSDKIGELTLFNYKYNSAEGWCPVNEYNENTPIEGEMRLGKIFDDSEIKNAVLEIIEKGGPVSKNNLPECLQFITSKKLNEVFIENLGSAKMYSKFPEDVCIIKA